MYKINRNPVKLKTLDMMQKLQQHNSVFHNKDLCNWFNISPSDASMRISRLRFWGLIIKEGKTGYRLSKYGERFKLDSEEKSLDSKSPSKTEEKDVSEVKTEEDS